MRFRVCLTRDITESHVMTVEATDIAQAQEIALERVDADCKFEIDDASPGELYVSWAASGGDS